MGPNLLLGRTSFSAILLLGGNCIDAKEVDHAREVLRTLEGNAPASSETQERNNPIQLKREVSVQLKRELSAAADERDLGALWKLVPLTAGQGVAKANLERAMSGPGFC